MATNLAEIATYYIDQARQGNEEDAFHSLLEQDPAIIPILQDAYRTEPDPDVVALLVEVIWQFRDPKAIPFLEEALRDARPRVWKSALDGLVTLGGTESAKVLERTLAAIQASDPKRAEWISEALEQVH